MYVDVCPRCDSGNDARAFPCRRRCRCIACLRRFRLSFRLAPRSVSRSMSALSGDRPHSAAARSDEHKPANDKGLSSEPHRRRDQEVQKVNVCFRGSPSRTTGASQWTFDFASVGQRRSTRRPALRTISAATGFFSSAATTTASASARTAVPLTGARRRGLRKSAVCGGFTTLSAEHRDDP